MSTDKPIAEYPYNVEGGPNGEPPAGFKRLHNSHLKDKDITDIRRSNTRLSNAWAVMRVGMRKAEKEKDMVNRQRAEFQCLLDILGAMHVGVSISEDDNG